MASLDSSDVGLPFDSSCSIGLPGASATSGLPLLLLLPPSMHSSVLFEKTAGGADFSKCLASLRKET